MYIEIDYNGKTYITKEVEQDEECTVESAAEALYAQFEKFNKAKFDLSDGSKLVIGKGAIENGVWRVVP